MSKTASDSISFSIAVESTSLSDNWLIAVIAGFFIFAGLGLAAKRGGK